MDAHERSPSANAATHQGHGAFLRFLTLDAQNFKGPETCWKLGARDDRNLNFRGLARGALVSWCFTWHGEPRIIAGVRSPATLYIGGAIG